MSYEQIMKDKVVLVTGASRGIGQGIALRFAKAGGTVIGTATSDEGAAKITERFQQENLSGIGVKLNVTTPGDIESVITNIKSQFGPVNILINNAAVTKDNLFLRMKEEDWLNVIETDLNAIFRLSKACIRDMLKAHWGRIITIGSVVGTIGNPGQANYCAAKAGVIGLSKSLAIEVGSRNITVNVISPGYIATDMTNVLTEEQKKSIYERIPMQKVGSVDDIAAATLFLSSDCAGYITGQTLHVNGGMYMA